MDVVDTYSVHKLPKDIPFDYFNTTKSKIITPSVYPKPLDLEQAKNIKMLVDQLELDAELADLKKLSDETKDIEYLLEFEALTLLPYQKAVKGHVLGSIYHQTLLLTNHLPNFSAKIRAVNLNDASISHALYTQQKVMAVQSQREKVVERQNNLLSASNDYKKFMNNRRIKYAKLGKHALNYHLQTEKEEQRRAERNAKQRLQALKANDEEAYVKLLDQTKDTRITHLLRQTNSFLSSLTQAVRDQQRETHEKIVEVGHLDAGETVPESEEEKLDADYYSVAHRIKEKIIKQPSILVGGTLKEYQLRGLEWMVSLYNNHLNGILADEMGLGKTIQTISLLTYIAEVKQTPGPFLVIVPLSTLPNWNIEFDKWAPSLKKISYKGAPAFRKELAQRVKAGDFNVLLTTYEYVIKDKSVLSKVKWVHMIIDEGHRMKNTKSKLSYTLTEFYHTDYRLILTVLVVKIRSSCLKKKRCWSLEDCIRC
ncbi:unnamed protein product [Ambrosiozyma monospora]|uniref:Unnamed protein product n=1 Tax=Ambrosiozyma monospora TaxID=43982 RepID=A0ACB5TCX9_AMBMO|nr:unnamed protein product [Ambrosiozyma monospora]